jgi:hypothetical protein
LIDIVAVGLKNLTAGCDLIGLNVVLAAPDVGVLGPDAGDEDLRPGPFGPEAPAAARAPSRSGRLRNAPASP